MAENLTIARPYAKAAFDSAVEHNALDQWQNMLQALALAC
ncbi:F0F1 ATP synthase subunit delta, partial [Enterobacter cloacae]